EVAGQIEANLEHPAGEFMWGAPGTLAAATFMHARTREERFAELFRRTARALSSRLEWSETAGCHFLSQELSAKRTNYLGAVHGFVGLAAPLIHGRALIPNAWPQWQRCITALTRCTVAREGPLASWRVCLSWPRGGKTEPVL